MNYDASVRYLLSLGRELAAPTQAAAAKFDLENISVLAERLGRPDRAYPSVHIAGTNGKGSTAAFLESILRHAGFLTGLYTSPHLERINERIRMNGHEISDEEFADTFARIQTVVEELLAGGKLRAHPTFFECVTALAFESFARSRVEFGIFEVGLGGRLDATNILQPLVSVITRIDFDHENFLGHSLKEIASEKAGIIKSGPPVIAADQRPEAKEVLHSRAAELHTTFVDTSEAYQLDVQENLQQPGRFQALVKEVATGWELEVAPKLPGKFQAQNVLNAIAASRLLQQRGYRIPDQSIKEGIALAEWPGRLEKLHSHPDVYLDGAHNPAAAAELRDFLRRYFEGRRIWMLFGTLRDKAVDEIAGIILPCVSAVVFTEPRTTRSISAAQLAEIAGHHASCFSVHPDAENGFENILSRASSTDAIFVTGSLYLVGQIRHYWNQRARVAAK
ncbi:MAG TPA: folylpolyglutamate synthase/dihydrofolate synthase family protein [Candidatus Acidoferrum sp.]|nr:folylpolyglutamate synthase/dihydrofolate synthase family protein [Candidatus Acidoferrum sp.]